MRDDELQQEFRPIAGTGVCGPGRQRMVLHGIDKLAAPVRPVADDGDIAFGGERQQPVFRIPVNGVVGELHEIDVFRRHDLCHVGMAHAVRSGDADITYPPGGFFGAQGFEMVFPIEKVMNLK
eukprot:NODE_15128_length_414_cov_0.804878_g15105_i0.p2 GENE.NODE_15128_length_414_cov_0.804878_g15105_i0~~NODE_15128_length_414_cov_0.804878_g15105_i0.p2  ORF type:complete len:123 (-),score=16.57 NODE_15128_length_414_cov_0.804878_g15105_i0:45-413(-)